MIKGPDAHSEKFLNDLATINTRIGRAEREISSGRRINLPSDSPDEISHLLSLRSGLGTSEQTKTNLSRVRTEVDAAEHALGDAILIVDRVQVAGAQGASDLLDAGHRRPLAEEVEQLLGQLVNLANTEISGRFIFAGDSDQVAPYGFNPSLDDAVSTYQGSATTRQVGHPSGGRFPISKTADTIFEGPGPGNDLFGSVNALRNALRDNDPPSAKIALAKIRDAAKYLNTQQAFYGGVQNRVNEASEFTEKQIVRLKQEISGVEDADVTASILDLTQGRQLQETTLAAEARRPRSSLFDYLR